MVNTPLTSVIDAAKDALSNAPEAACDAANTSILPANEDDAFTKVVLTVDIDAAKEELLFVIELDSVSILRAADELFVVTVVDREFIVETNEEDPA